MKNDEKSIVLHRRSAWIRVGSVVLITLILLFSLCIMPVSAASYPVPYATYTYNDISTICVDLFSSDDPGGYEEEIGDWTYSRVSGARPNKFIVSMKEAGSTFSTIFQFSLRYDIGKIFEPGSYTFEFDIEPSIPANYTFLGWNKLWYRIDEAVQEVEKTNPSLRTGDDGNSWYSVSMSQGSSSAGTKLWKGLLTLTFDKPTRVSNLSFIYPIHYDINQPTNPSWNADGFIFFCSDLKITTYTDNPGAIQKYDPPTIEGSDEYDQATGELESFTGQQETATLELMGFDLNSVPQLAQAMLAVSYLFDNYVFPLEPVNLILRISVAVGLLAVILSVVVVSGIRISKRDKGGG